MKPILYYAEQCPDTAPFVAELKRLGVEYEEVEVLSSIPNLKQFLRLRDNHAEDGRVILDETQLKAIFA